MIVSNFAQVFVHRSLLASPWCLIECWGSLQFLCCISVGLLFGPSLCYWPRESSLGVYAWAWGRAWGGWEEASSSYEVAFFTEFCHIFWLFTELHAIAWTCLHIHHHSFLYSFPYHCMFFAHAPSMFISFSNEWVVLVNSPQLPTPPTNPFSQGKYSHCLSTFYLYNCFGRWNPFRVMGDVCCYVQEYNKTLLIHHLGTTCYKLHFFLAFDV